MEKRNRKTASGFTLHCTALVSLQQAGRETNEYPLEIAYAHSSTASVNYSYSNMHRIHTSHFWLVLQIADTGLMP